MTLMTLDSRVLNFSKRVLSFSKRVLNFSKRQLSNFSMPTSNASICHHFIAQKQNMTTTVSIQIIMLSFNVSQMNKVRN